MLTVTAFGSTSSDLYSDQDVSSLDSNSYFIQNNEQSLCISPKDWENLDFINVLDLEMTVNGEPLLKTASRPAIYCGSTSQDISLSSQGEFDLDESDISIINPMKLNGFFSKIDFVSYILL